ncbi:MAG: ABC transporter permease [Polyangiales bacterium]
MTLAGLAARNILRSPFRTFLTVMGVVVATITFILLRTVVTAWTAAADYAAKDRVATRHKITFVMTLPKRYIDDVRATPHIREATYANWFGGKDPKHDREFFATIAIDSPTFFKVYDDIVVPPAQLADYMKDPAGAVIGDSLAKTMGWKVGDKVILQSGIYANQADWEFHIRGIYDVKSKAVDRQTLYFHWDYLDKTLPPSRAGHIGWIVSRVDDPAKTADIAVALDKSFDDREIQTLSQDEHAFQASFLAGFSAVLTALNLVSGVILVIMLLVLGNTIAMGVRERTSEYGAMKALGFTGGHIVFFIVTEALLTAVIGGVIGIGVAVPFVNQGLGRWLEEHMGNLFPHFRVEPVSIVLALSITFLFGAFAAVIPALSASRLKVVDALRRVA